MKNKEQNPIDALTQKALFVCAIIVIGLLTVIAINGFKIRELDEKIIENQKELIQLQIFGS